MRCVLGVVIVVDWDFVLLPICLGQIAAVAHRFSTKHGVFVVGGATVGCKVAVGLFSLSKDIGIAWVWFEVGSV